MRAVVFEGTGGNDVVTIEDRADPVPAGTEVVVATRFVGLNPADVLQRDGRYPPPSGAPSDVPGLEVAGDVVARGDSVSRWKIGDRVMGIVGGGGLADRVAIDESCLASVPKRLSQKEAAAVPETYITAHDALVTRGDLSGGDFVLINGATGGVGTAAVQIAGAVGAHVIGSARSSEGRKFVEGLGASAVSSLDFVEEVDALTDGSGVDVILELVGAPHFPSNLKVVANEGRIVVVGVAAGSKIEVPLLRLMSKRASLIGTVLRSRETPEKATAVRMFERDVVPLLANGTLHPVIDSVFPSSQVDDAFDYLVTAGKRGKVLLDMGQ